MHLRIVFPVSVKYQIHKIVENNLTSIQLHG